MTKVGRPTKYSEEILTKTREYIDSCEDKVRRFHKTVGDRTDSYERLVVVKIPTLEGLAVHLKINKDTIQEWRKEEGKEEFSVLIDELLAKQADRLANNGLSGDYNPTIAKVLLAKHGYREGIEHSGVDGGPIKHDIEERKKVEEAIDDLI